MKNFVYFCLPVFYVSANKLFKNEKENATSLAIAINAILEKFSFESNRMDIRIYGTNQGLPDLDKILSENKKIPVEVKRFTSKENILQNINESAIVILESEEFAIRHSIIREFYKPIRFFVYIRKGALETLRRLALIDIDWRRKRSGSIKLEHWSEMTSLLHLQYFIVDEKSSVKLYTFVWYSLLKCSEPQLIEVNNFNKRTNKWKHSQFTIKKFNNFHGCQLTFGQWTNYVYGGYADTENLAKLISELQNSLSFKQEISSLLCNYVTSECFFTNPDLTMDLFISHQIYNELRNFTSYHITQPYLFLPTKLAVPPGELYDEYEKLLLPFDELTWLLIGITFIAAFTTIFFFNFLSDSVKNYFFGEVASPSLNILMIFSGISQVVLPRRNFARFLVMMFIIYSLIMRTAWQSQMFKFLQKDMRKPQIKSLDELIEKNFPLYVWSGFANYVNETDLVQRVKFVILDAEQEAYQNLLLKDIFDSSFRGATPVGVHVVRIYTKRTRGKFLERVLPEILFTEFQGMSFPQFHRFFEVFEEKLQQLFTGGLINVHSEIWVKPENFKKYKHFYSHLEGPKVLTLEHLEAGFVVWLISIIFAIFAFMLEWLMTFCSFFVIKFVMKKCFQLGIGEN